MASPQVKGGALRNRIRERVPIFGVGSQTRDTQGFVYERQVSILTDIVKLGQSHQTAATHKDKQIKNCATVSNLRMVSSEGTNRLTPSLLPSPSISYLVQSQDSESMLERLKRVTHLAVQCEKIVIHQNSRHSSRIILNER